MRAKPSIVFLNDVAMKETSTDEGYSWKNLDKGGLLTIRRKNGDHVIVLE
jgi:hypothetical protein